MTEKDEESIRQRIYEHLKRNNKCTAVKISQALGINRSIANKHLYSLQNSNEIQCTAGNPPVWFIKDKNETESTPALTPEKSSPEKRDLIEALRSAGKTGLKAHQIASKLGQTRQDINKQLHSLRETGGVQQSEDTHMWTLNDERLDQQREMCETGLGQVLNSGLHQSFDVITKLGEGGYGCVYKVKHKYDDMFYAVKMVQYTGEANSEVKALARLKHPNIVRYITCWRSEKLESSHSTSRTSTSGSDWMTFQKPEGSEGSSSEKSDDVTGTESQDPTAESESSAGLSGPDDGTCLCIQMEFCERGTLTAWIQARNFGKEQRTTMEIHKIFYEIVSGVAYIHSNNLIHRDLKPDNILFDNDGKVKIGDFGLVAAQTDQNGADIERSKRKGTLAYMSPEQGNKRTYDAKTDIYPLGLIWFEMLWKLSTGTERFKLWPDLRNRRFPEQFCVDHPTEKIFMKDMLSHDPDERPDAKEIKKLLEIFLISVQNMLNQKTV